MCQVGYSRVDITPQESVPLAGYGNTSMRMSQNVLSPLCSACMALTDEADTTVLLIHNDLIGTPAFLLERLQAAITQKTGVPAENIIIGATHTHSAPDIHNKDKDSIPRYLDLLEEKISENAARAMADRKPCTGASMAKTRTKDLNFVRHYVMADGSYKGDNFGKLDYLDYAGHTTQADPEMRLVKFHRENAEDVLLVNWQTHPHRTGGSKKYDVSADIVGAMRDEMEAAIGCKFIYFTGGGGNVNPHSRIKSENRTADFLEQGKALAEHALSAEGRYEPLTLENIKLCTKRVWAELNRPDSKLLEGAKIAYDHWLKTNDPRSSIELAQSYGINSPYAAGNFIRRSKAEEDGRYISFTAVSFGDLAFVTAPYEMFDTNAKYVRDFSPFPMTVVASCANGSNGYVPSAYGYIHGCYEADCTVCKPGSGERFADVLVKMLESFKEE